MTMPLVPQTGPTALDTLKGICKQYQLNLNDMLSAAVTTAQRNQVLAGYADANTNYWKCVDHAFQEDDLGLQQLIADGQVVIVQLKTIDTQLGNIAKVIDIVTNAVHIGGTIAAKVIKA